VVTVVLAQRPEDAVGEGPPQISRDTGQQQHVRGELVVADHRSTARAQGSQAAGVPRFGRGATQRPGPYGYAARPDVEGQLGQPGFERVHRGPDLLEDHGCPRALDRHECRGARAGTPARDHRHLDDGAEYLFEDGRGEHVGPRRRRDDSQVLAVRR
jgi:hypothetical protein